MRHVTDPPIDHLIATVKKAGERIAQAEAERGAAADDRALAIADLATAIGPTDAARKLDVALSTIQKARDRAKLVRALRAAGKAS